MADKLTKKEIQEISAVVGKSVPDEIIAILEKDELTDEEFRMENEFFGTVDQIERGKIVSQRHREAAKKYCEQHPPLPDSEWF